MLTKKNKIYVIGKMKHEQLIYPNTGTIDLNLMNY